MIDNMFPDIYVFRVRFQTNRPAKYICWIEDITHLNMSENETQESLSTMENKEEFACEWCKKICSSLEYLEIHKKSKRHKKIIKKARGEVHSKGISSQDAGSIDGKQDSMSFKYSDHITRLRDTIVKREKYVTKTHERYEHSFKTYINTSIAYWTVHLASNPTVRDFKVTIYEEKWKPFGQAAIEVSYARVADKEPANTTYVFKFKHVTSNNNTTIKTFSEGMFKYETFIEEIEKTKGNKDGSNIRFYVITTAGFDSLMEQSWEVNYCLDCKGRAALCNNENHQNKENIRMFAKHLTNQANLKFNSSDDNESVFRMINPCLKKCNLPDNVYIFTCQKTLRALCEDIELIISYFIEKPSIRVVDEYIKFIHQWKNQYMSFKLKKEDVLMELGELMLSSFRVTPKLKFINEEDSNRFSAWISALRSTDVTIIESMEIKLSNLLEPFNIMIKKELNIGNDHEEYIDSLTVYSDVVANIENPELRSYVIEEIDGANKKEISLDKLYSMFWKVGQMPFVMRVYKAEKIEYIFHVINVLKKLGLNRKYLLQTNNKITEISTESYKNISFFINVDNIADSLGPQITNNVLIGTSKGHAISLAEIQQSDPLFQKSISAYEFFEMSLGRFRLKWSGYPTDGYSETKLILSNEQVSAIESNLKDSEDNNEEESFSNFNFCVPTKPRNDIKPDLFDTR